ncbi:ABC transporter substrate-binding protein [Clostridium senegalense]
MRKQKIYSLILAVSLTASILSGCGNTNKASKEVSSNPASEQKNYKEVIVNNDLPSGKEDETFSTAPKKAVTLSGFTTEMLLALGLEDSIAGYSFQDNEVLPEYKDAHSKLNKLSDLMPSKETLLGVEPDFITGWMSTFTENNFNNKFCKENNVKIYVPKCESPNATMETVYEDFTNLGKIFNVEKNSEDVISKMKKDIEAISSKIPKDTKPVKAFVYDSGTDSPFTACNGLPTDLIKLAGGENIFKDGEKPWAKVTWEEVVKQNPEQIIVMQYNAADDVEEKINFLKNHDALKDVDAIKNNKIFVLELSEVVAGVRNPGAIKAMAENFHPEIFKK